MNEIIVGVLLLLGTGFMLVAALGVARLPDLWMRMHASTKAGTLGAGLLLLSMAVNFGSLSVVTMCMATIFFLVMTAPVAAHLIGRAGYFAGEPLWEGTVLDEFKEDLEEELQRKTEGSPDEQ